MAKDTKTITIPNLISAMKRAGFVTNDSLEKRLGKFGKGLRKQINDDQFEARSEFYTKMTKPEIDKVNNKLDKNTEKLSFEISELKDDLSGLTAEFSTHHHTSALRN
jgi:Sec-independent protein translocase protein TatA